MRTARSDCEGRQGGEPGAADQQSAAVRRRAGQHRHGGDHRVSGRHGAALPVRDEGGRWHRRMARRAPEATFSLSFTYPIQERAAAQRQGSRRAWRQKQAAQRRRKWRRHVSTRTSSTASRTGSIWRKAGCATLRRSRRRQRPTDRIPVSRQLGHPAVFVVQDEHGRHSGRMRHGQANGQRRAGAGGPDDGQGDLIVVQRTAAHFGCARPTRSSRSTTAATTRSVRIPAPAPRPPTSSGGS